ncbi:META domain-containing protein, partial [Candidatus Gracilibacteria bacterium]|nr:META domain-containing protein [Candidatus Gracilibacteria bacterium]
MRAWLRCVLALTMIGLSLGAVRAVAAQGDGLSADAIGKEWFLVELKPASGDTVDALGRGISITFNADGTANGTDGCNTFNTAYTAAADGTMTIQQGASTLKACEQAIMDLAMQFNTAMTAVTGYTLTDAGFLELSFDGSGVLKFGLASTPVPLPGTLPTTGGSPDLSGWLLLLALAIFACGLGLRRHLAGLVHRRALWPV